MTKQVVASVDVNQKKQHVGKQNTYKVGPLPIINGLITPKSRAITLVNHLQGILERLQIHL